MIRRITRNNDYKDIIKSCPAGVIDYVYRVDYYVSGHPEVFVQLTPVKVGEHLEVVISTEALENLTYNGVLMRRAYYSQADSEYPDDSYDLEFVDNMNVWLGEEDTAAPFDPGYLTEDDLKTINGESIVGEGNLEIEAVIPDYYATKSWVSDQGYLKSVPSGYATESWVSGQGYLTEVPSGYATESWVSSNFLSTTALTGYATESWVQSQGYLTSVPSEYATQSWVSSNFLSTTALTGYATESWVSSNYFEASKIWTGTSSQWAQLTSEQQAFYTIALVTE